MRHDYCHNLWVCVRAYLYLTVLYESSLAKKLPKMPRTMQEADLRRRTPWDFSDKRMRRHILDFSPLSQRVDQPRSTNSTVTKANQLWLSRMLRWCLKRFPFLPPLCCCPSFQVCCPVTTRQVPTLVIQRHRHAERERKTWCVTVQSTNTRVHTHTWGTMPPYRDSYNSRDL